MCGWFSKVSQGCRKSGGRRHHPHFLHAFMPEALRTEHSGLLDNGEERPFSEARAQINQIAQVAIELSIKRGATSLTMLKAEERSFENLHRPYTYWTKDLNVRFEEERRTSGRIELGLRLKDVRTKRGLSQTELSKLVGVTPSTISQVESNLIYPSLPALLKMAEVLSVDVSYFFQDRVDVARRIVFSASEALEIKLPDMPDGLVVAKLLTPIDFDGQAEPYMIEMAPDSKASMSLFCSQGGRGRLRTLRSFANDCRKSG